MQFRFIVALTVTALLASAGVALAEETAPAKPSKDHGTEEPAEEPSAGVALDLGMYSVYAFRGLNVFQKDSQWDQHAFLAPGATWTIGKTGLALGYWGAYQLIGSNIGSNVDKGLGAEQDLTATYTLSFGDNATAGLSFTAYLFPFADEPDAGTSTPAYLEPCLFATYATAVDLSLKVAYFHGVQEAVEAYRYLYVNPSVGKTLPLGETVSLALSAAFGYKFFTDTSTTTSETNTADIGVTAALPIAMQGSTYLKPNASLAWTNLDKDFSEEMMAYGGVNLGGSF